MQLVPLLHGRFGAGVSDASLPGEHDIGVRAGFPEERNRALLGEDHQAPDDS